MNPEPVNKSKNQTINNKNPSEFMADKSKKIDIQVNDIIRHALRNEPIQGTIENSKAPNDLIQIYSTKRRRTQKKLVYRTLFIDDEKELVLIIPSDLSVEIARNGLSELKKLSQRIQEGIPQLLSAGGKIFQEYDLLHQTLGWSLRDVEEQITFDFLVALLMSRDKGATEEIREYGRYFINALLEHLCVPQNQIQSFLEDVNRNLDEGLLPLKPDSGFIVGLIYKDVAEIRRNWSDKIDKMIIQKEEPDYILLSFWLVGYQNKYWSILDTHHDLGRYNRLHRNEIVGEYLEKLLERIQEAHLPLALSPSAIKSFLSELKPNIKK